MTNRGIDPAPGELAAFCRRRHIRRLSLFGSILREDFGPQSDVDILVVFAPGHVPGFVRHYEMQQELSSLFGGRQVDLRTPKNLSPFFRDEVVKHAQVQYVGE